MKKYHKNVAKISHHHPVLPVAANNHAPPDEAKPKSPCYPARYDRKEGIGGEDIHIFGARGV